MVSLGVSEWYLGHREPPAGREPHAALGAACTAPHSIVAGASHGAGTVPSSQPGCPVGEESFGTRRAPAPRKPRPLGFAAQCRADGLARPAACGRYRVPMWHVPPLSHPAGTSTPMSRGKARRDQLHTFTNEPLLFFGFIQTRQVRMRFLFLQEGWLLSSYS